MIYGGIHATLFPAEAQELGGAHAVVKGDGDLVWATALSDCVAGSLKPVYEGGRVEPEHLLPARWDLLPPDRYMWASVQTVRGCPKHCSFCSVWKTDGQRPRQRASDGVIGEIVALRRKGFRFIALADDNFYPVTLTDLKMAARRTNQASFETLSAIRAERFDLMRRLAALPSDMVFFTQITMEAAEDPEFLDAMRNARIKGALVGIESVSPEGLKDVHKGFNVAGDALVERLRGFRDHGVHVLGSFIFGLPSDREPTFDATVAVAQQAGVTFAQFVMLTPFPGTNDFAAWESIHGRRPDADRRRASHAALADPAGPTPEGVHAASHHGAGRDPARHPARLGPVLQPPEHLGALRLRAVVEIAPGVRADVEAVPSDVRQHRHRHRQCARGPVSAVGPLDRPSLPPRCSSRDRCPTSRYRREPTLDGTPGWRTARWTPIVDWDARYMMSDAANDTSRHPRPHTPPLAGPFLEFDLLAELERLRDEPASTSGQNARTLVKFDDFRVVLMTLRAGVRLGEHHTKGRISIHTVVGRLRVRADGRTFDLRTGTLLALDRDLPHDVEAVEDSAFLLTIAWRQG